MTLQGAFSFLQSCVILSHNSKRSITHAVSCTVLDTCFHRRGTSCGACLKRDVYPVPGVHMMSQQCVSILGLLHLCQIRRIMTRALRNFQCQASWSPMKSIIWVLVSPMLHVIAFVTALVFVTVGTIIGHLTPQQPSTMANGTVENTSFQNEATTSEPGPQQPTSPSGAKPNLRTVLHRHSPLAQQYLALSA